MGSERGDEYKRLRPVGEGTGSKESEYSEAPQRATTSRLVPTHQQDHRAIKRRCASMAGFNSFANAAITIAGNELAHRIRKGQFSLGRGRRRRGWSRKPNGQWHSHRTRAGKGSRPLIDHNALDAPEPVFGILGND